jgi:acetylglutamate kinase
MESLASKAQTLVDALPSIRALRGSTIVVKYGGSVMDESVYADSILTDICFLREMDILTVLVHGGGKAITTKMREEGITPKFVNGLRFTDKKTITIVEKVLGKTINPQIVKFLNDRGTKAGSLSGKKVLKAKKLVTVSPEGEKLSLGFVGDIVKVNKQPILSLLKKGIIPVITPLGAANDGSALNINADIAASKIAGELKASHLIFLSDTNGILEDSQQPDSTISKISETEIAALRNTGVINGGMVPKVNASIDALRKGVRRVKLLNGQHAHCILIDLFFGGKIGTEIIKAVPAA